MGHRRMAILDHRRPGAEHLLVAQLALQRALRYRRDELQIERHRFADTLYLLQERRGRAEDGSECSEPVEKRFGDRLGVAARDQPEEQQLEDFIIGQRAVAILAEAVA